MIHLQTIRVAPFPAPLNDTFPFRVPTINALAGGELALSADVTFFVGENGSGKSTLLEAIALAARAISVGSSDLERDESLAAPRLLAEHMKLVWSRRSHRGFFLRAEDFFGYARRMQAMRSEAEAELEKLRNDRSLSDKARGLASMPHARTVAEIRSRYGEGLDSVSHGESFLTLFRSRLVPNGLYLLDEPEAPLSPVRQLALLTMIKELVAQQNAQFIIATHSPLLMAFPNATILSFDSGRIQPVAYDEVEHVTLTRDFLNNPQRFLRQL
jgi:predicted ATPase